MSDNPEFYFGFYFVFGSLTISSLLTDEGVKFVSDFRTDIPSGKELFTTKKLWNFIALVWTTPYPPRSCETPKLCSSWSSLLKKKTRGESLDSILDNKTHA